MQSPLQLGAQRALVGWPDSALRSQPGGRVGSSQARCNWGRRRALAGVPQNIGRAEKSKTISLTPVGGSLVQAPAALSVFIGLIHLCGLIYERDR